MQKDQTTDGEVNSTGARPANQARGKFMFGLLGAAAVAAIAFAISRARSSSLPTITRADFEAAQRLWADSDTPDYQIVVQVKGMQPGRYEVTVQDDLATAAKFDGRDLTRRRTFGTWSVNGMFDTLSRDFETNDEAGYLLLKAEFHPEFGYPMKYERIEMRTGAHDALQWEVTEFRKN